MRTHTQHDGTAIVIDLCGELTAGEGVCGLRKALSTTTGTGRDLVLNFEHVVRLDCAGIGELVRLHCALEQAGAVLTLVHLSERHQRMLDVARLSGVLRIRDNVADALAARTRTVTAVLSTRAVNPRSADASHLTPATVGSRSMEGAKPWH
jgi:anti-anti-sigma factor